MKFGFSPPFPLHLDSEYRKRWMEFHHADGKIDDSRNVNWRQVKWNDLVGIKVSIKDQVHFVNSSDNNFRFFITFRWNGKEAIYEHGKLKGRKSINEWTIGWSDGINAFLKYIDFYTGNLVKETTEDISQYKSHIHPSVK